MPDATLKRHKPITALRSALEAYWRQAECMTDVAFYTPEEWTARGEPYGQKALLHATFEGPLYAALNYGEPSWDVHTRTHEIVAEHGYWFEMGFAWSLHVYS